MSVIKDIGKGILSAFGGMIPVGALFKKAPLTEKGKHAMPPQFQDGVDKKITSRSPSAYGASQSQTKPPSGS